MDDLYPLSRKLKICPYCAADRREPDPAHPFEHRRENGLADFLAELRRNFRYDAPFEPIWAEAVGS